MALFEADAVIRRIAAEPALIVGGGRALLLQLAHPKVAQGVADRSASREAVGRCGSESFWDHQRGCFS